MELLTIRRALLAVACIASVGCSKGGDSAAGPTTSTGTPTPTSKWSTQSAPGKDSLTFQAVSGGATLGGSGAIYTPPITPMTGPAVPAYTGDTFTITSGTVTSNSINFSASLGANPVGDGTFYHGSLSFSGSLSGNTMTGTLIFTPPRTASQIFATQTVNGVTMVVP